MSKYQPGIIYDHLYHLGLRDPSRERKALVAEAARPLAISIARRFPGATVKRANRPNIWRISIPLKTL